MGFDCLPKRRYNTYIQKQKEQTMRNDTLTVAELIAILSKVDPTLPVKMSMNMEYESYVDASMVGVRDYDNGPRLYISDTLDYEDEDNG
jgi:hypothetical protein